MYNLVAYDFIILMQLHYLSIYDRMTFRDFAVSYRFIGAIHVNSAYELDMIIFELIKIVRTIKPLSIKYILVDNGSCFL